MDTLQKCLEVFHADQGTADRGASPLMSNNPFRNKIHSHISPEPSPRPISTNPFLDITEVNQGAVETNHDAVTMNSSVNKATDAFVRAYFETKRLLPANHHK